MVQYGREDSGYEKDVYGVDFIGLLGVRHDKAPAGAGDPDRGGSGGKEGKTGDAG